MPTVTWDGELQEWRKIKEALLRDLMMIAWNFHAAALRSCGVLLEEKKRHQSCIYCNMIFGKLQEYLVYL